MTLKFQCFTEHGRDKFYHSAHHSDRNTVVDKNNSLSLQALLLKSWCFSCLLIYSFPTNTAHISTGCQSEHSSDLTGVTHNDELLHRHSEPPNKRFLWHGLIDWGGGVGLGIDGQTTFQNNLRGTTHQDNVPSPAYRF